MSKPLLLDELREHVDARLRQWRGEGRIVGREDASGAVAPGLRSELLHARAGDDRGDLVAELHGLGEDAEGALDELALVILEVDEGRH